MMRRRSQRYAILWDVDDPQNDGSEVHVQSTHCMCHALSRAEYSIRSRLEDLEQTQSKMTALLGMNCP